MRFELMAIVIASMGAGCAVEGGVELGSRGQESNLGACGLGDELLSQRVLTPADVPALSALEKAQIVEAVRESAHTDVTTAEEAILRVDDDELYVAITRDSGTNQYYVDISYWVGDNPYGAILYWDTAVKGAAIHDGFPEECGPLTYAYDEGDTAPECGGFVTYANTATYAALDAYLPSNVAQAIVNARPFDSVADVVAVNGVAETRLQQILSAARTAGLVGTSCAGIHDQLAISTTEAAAIVALVNEASEEELHGILSGLIDETVVDALLADRPFGTAAEISATYRVGPATFRTLRNAATFRGPWEELVAEVNEIDRPDGQVRFAQHFAWLPLVTDPGYGLTDMTCFGIDPNLLPVGATDRPALADGDEVVDVVSDWVATTNFQGALDVDPAAGLADLAFRSAGQAFFGCYIDYHPNPWQYDSQIFFVDTETGAGVLVTWHYVE